jgi:peptide/nickel transport system permease protein
MSKFILKRLIQVAFLTFIFVSITFIILQLMPGDVSNIYLDPNIPSEARNSIRERFGIDLPVYRQYFLYMKNFIRGDLGYSFRLYPRTVWSVIMERLPRTFLLFSTATIAYYYIGYSLGKFIAWKRGRKAEYAATFSGVFLYTLFLPVYALLLMWFFGLHLKWLPLGQFLSPLVWKDSPAESSLIFNYIILSSAIFLFIMFCAVILSKMFRLNNRLSKVLLFCSASSSIILLFIFWLKSGYLRLGLDILRHMVLPVVTLATASFAGSMLLMRDSMLETIKEDYITTAKAKGLTDAQVRDRHAARTALLPIVTSFSLAAAGVINGGIITETIFSWPGMGLTLIESIRTNDWPLALGAFAFTGIFILLAHLIADILYAVLDPRIRF